MFFLIRLSKNCICKTNEKDNNAIHKNLGIPDTCKGIVTVEMNMMAQMREDVIIACKNKYPTFSVATAEHVPKIDEIITFCNTVINGTAKEEEVF